MNQPDIIARILAADEARYQALYAQDVAALSSMLHDDYLHTHATGKTDTKQAFLESIGAARYRFLLAERSQQVVRLAGDCALLSGVTRTSIEVGPQQKTMHNAFVMAWVAEGGDWKLLHWQATKLPDA